MIDSLPKAPWEDDELDDSGLPKAPWETPKTQQVQQPIQEESGFLRRYVADPAVSLGKGLVSANDITLGLADLATGGYAGKKLEEVTGYNSGEVQNFLESKYSPEQQRINQGMANEDGFLNKLAYAVKNPSTIAHSVLESTPSMAIGGMAARGMLGVAPKAMQALGSGVGRVMGVTADYATPLVAGAIGEGGVQTMQAAEQARQDSPDKLLSAKAAGSAIASGVLDSLIALGSGKVAEKLGIADKDLLMAGGKTKKLYDAEGKEINKGLFRRTLEGALNEGVLQELPQSAQEQIFQNLASDKPWDEGVSESAVMGMLSGIAMGAGASVYDSIPKSKTDSIGDTKQEDQNKYGIPGDIKSMVDSRRSALPSGYSPLTPQQRESERIRNSIETSRMRDAQDALMGTADQEQRGARDLTTVNEKINRVESALDTFNVNDVTADDLISYLGDQKQDTGFQQIGRPSTAEESENVFNENPDRNNGLESALTIADGINNGKINTPYIPENEDKTGIPTNVTDRDIASLSLDDLKKVRPYFEKSGRNDLLGVIDNHIADKQNNIPNDLRLIFGIMNDEINQGGVEGRTDISDTDTPLVVGKASTHQQWVKDINKAIDEHNKLSGKDDQLSGFGKNQFNSLYKNMVKGKPLTKKQQMMWDILSDKAKEYNGQHPDSVDALNEKYFSEKGLSYNRKQPIQVEDLQFGDKLLIEKDGISETFEVKGIDDEGNVILKDGELRKIPAFEKVHDVVAVEFTDNPKKPEQYTSNKIKAMDIPDQSPQYSDDQVKKVVDKAYQGDVDAASIVFDDNGVLLPYDNIIGNMLSDSELTSRLTSDVSKSDIKGLVQSRRDAMASGIKPLTIKQQEVNRIKDSIDTAMQYKTMDDANKEQRGTRDLTPVTQKVTQAMIDAEDAKMQKANQENRGSRSIAPITQKESEVISNGEKGKTETETLLNNGEAVPVEETKPVEKPSSTEQIKQAITKVESRGDFLHIAKIRAELPNMDKKTFDDAMEEIVKSGEFSWMNNAKPTASLSQEQKDSMIEFHDDGRGMKNYRELVVRNEQPPSKKPDVETTKDGTKFIWDARNEHRYFGTEAKFTNKFGEKFDGKITRVLHSGVNTFVEFAPNGSESTYRVNPNEIEVTKLVDHGEKKKPTESKPNEDKKKEPQRKRTATEIADDLAKQGVHPQASYGLFVKELDLNPEMDAKEWLKIYNQSLAIYGKEQPALSQNEQKKQIDSEILDAIKKNKYAKNWKITQLDNGDYRVDIGGGKYFDLKLQDSISLSKGSVEQAYGKSPDEMRDEQGELLVVAGSYNRGEQTIRIRRDTSNNIIFDHEFYHFLEHAGLITDAEMGILKDKIRQMVKEGKWETRNAKDIGGSEDRAQFIAESLDGRRNVTGLWEKIVQRIQDFLDWVNDITGYRSAESIVRDVASGKVTERNGDKLDAIREQQYQYEYDDQIEYSIITDNRLLNKLESGKKIKAFRAMQLIDGELYPPMSAKINGRLREPTKIGQWEQADENPELASNGKFKLDKANKSSITAAYNPYFHTSHSPLNDQFSSAYKRPNLVTVEVEIPASELTSGYKAEGAKDSVGEKQWHAGPVSSKLSSGKKRTVTLSRYAKVVRVVPDSEVAGNIAKMLEGENVTIPENVVTPSLKDELIKKGVPVVSKDGNIEQPVFAGKNATGYEQAEKEGRVFLGKFDDKSRFYVDDSGAKLKNWDSLPKEEFFPGNNDSRVKLSDVLEHDELFKNYPETKDIVFVKKNMFANTLGWFSPEQNTIAVNSDLSQKEAILTILHEVQHWIQGKENFASGGNTNLISTINNIDKVKSYISKNKPELSESVEKLEKEIPVILNKESKKAFLISQLSEIKDRAKVLLDKAKGILDVLAEKYKDALFYDDRKGGVFYTFSVDYTKTEEFKKLIKLRDNALDDWSKKAITKDEYYDIKNDVNSKLDGLKDKYDRIRKTITDASDKIYKLNEIANSNGYLHHDSLSKFYKEIENIDKDVESISKKYKDGVMYYAYKIIGGEIESRDVSAIHENRKMIESFDKKPSSRLVDLARKVISAKKDFDESLDYIDYFKEKERFRDELKKEYEYFSDYYNNNFSSFLSNKGKDIYAEMANNIISGKPVLTIEKLSELESHQGIDREDAIVTFEKDGNGNLYASYGNVEQPDFAKSSNPEEIKQAADSVNKDTRSKLEKEIDADRKVFQSSKNPSIFDKWLLSPMYKKSPQMQASFRAATEWVDAKFRFFDNLIRNPDNNEVLNKVMKDLKSNLPKKYKRLTDYLLKKDRTGDGYYVTEDKNTGEFKLIPPSDLALRGERKEEIFTHEEEARAKGREYEIEDYKNKHKDADDLEINSLINFRKIADNTLSMRKQSLKRYIDELEAQGKPVPDVVYRDDDGKEIKVNLKRSLAEMDDLWGTYFPRLRMQGGLQMKATRKNADGSTDRFMKFYDFAFLNDKGSYLKNLANKAIGLADKIGIETLPGMRAKLEKEGYTVSVREAERLPENIFLEVAGKQLAIEKMMDRVIQQIDEKTPKTLKDIGIEGKWSKDKKDYIIQDYSVLKGITADVLHELGAEYRYRKKGNRGWGEYVFKDASEDIEERIRVRLFKLNNISSNVSMELAAILTESMADLIRSHGARSGMLKRGEDYWEGFENDPAIAITRSAQSVAGGESKRMLAQSLINIINGTSVSIEEFKKGNPDLKGDKLLDAYQDFVKESKVDPAKQSELWSDIKSYMDDLLRNEEKWDRVVGQFTGLAVAKYLALRVSAPIANLTAMATTVPASMNAHSGIDFKAIPKLLTKAAVQYTKYLARTNEYSSKLFKNPEDFKGIDKRYKAIFDEIVAKGWDKAQYNYEAVSVLRNKLGQQWDRVMDWGMAMFGVTEQVNRATTIAATAIGIMENKYGKSYDKLTNKEFEESFNESLMKAHETSNYAHGVYGKSDSMYAVRGAGAMNNIFKSNLTFKKFAINYMMNLYKIGVEEKNMKAAAYMILSPAIVGGFGASMVSMIPAVLSAMGVGSDDWEEDFYKFVDTNFGKNAEHAARFGIPGLLGVNFKGSVDVANVGMPKNLVELFGAPASVAKDVYEGISNISEGNVQKGIEGLLPNAFASISKAQREYTEGATKDSNAPIFYGTEPLKLDFHDAVMKALSFSPADMAEKKEILWNDAKIIKKYTEQKNDILDKFRKYYLNPIDKQDKEKLYELQLEVMKFNDKLMKRNINRGMVSPINAQSIRTSIRRAMRPSARERFRGASLAQRAEEETE